MSYIIAKGKWVGITKDGNLYSIMCIDGKWMELIVWHESMVYLIEYCMEEGGLGLDKPHSSPQVLPMLVE